jgi:YidC/Oxa1 family membrane protein insertase
MDRQSLLAFLLIGIIIVFYPWYMNMVAPVDADVSNEYIIQDNPSAIDINDTPKPRSEPFPSKDSSEDKIFNIKNNLYDLKLSNKNGGSVVSYELYNFSDHSGQLVNLIDEVNSDNLLIGFISTDGDKTLLNNNWSILNPGSILTIDRGQKSVTFSTSYQGQLIKKVFTFYSDSYNIDIDIVFEDPSKFISRNQYSLIWSGGLPPTEKNVSNDFQFFEGFASLGGEHMGTKPKKGKISEDTQKGSTLWSAVKTKYFLSAIIPDEPGVAARIKSELLEKRPVYETEISQKTSSSNNFTLYMGPLDYNNLKSFGVGLESNVDLGWALFRPIGQLISWLLSKMYAIIPNYGIVVIVFAFLIKLLLNPLTVKTFESTRKMQALAPEINKIKERYKNDPQKMSRAQMELYKSSGANPMGGCLPMLIQMPILVSVFSIFRSKIEFRGAPFFGWISDLSVPDTLIELGGFPINILPVLMGSTMFIQQKMMAAPNADANQKTMMYFMNAFFLFLFYSFPSGLNLYYFVFNLLSIIQQKYLIPNPAAAVVTAKK